jgi:DNA-binding transcriptional LysR family regulator
LESGQTDIAIAGFYGEPPPGFYQQKLFEDEFVVILRKNHPRIKSRLSIAQYAREAHVRIAMHGELRGEFDRYLEKMDINRNIVAGLSSFTSPAWILCETDLLLTAPRKLAEKYAEYLPIKILPAPMEIKNVTIMQVWHSRTQKDPFQKWMREEMRKLF